MLAPHFIQLLISSRPAAIARIKPLVNTPFVFFFAVNTLRDTSGFFNMLLLIYGAGLPPLCQKPLFYFYFFLISGQPVQAHFSATGNNSVSVMRSRLFIRFSEIVSFDLLFS